MSDPTRDATGDRATPPRVVGPRLRRLLRLVIVLVAALSANSVYLASVTLLEWSTGATLENLVYLAMFLLHVGLGLVLVVPFLVFAVLHARLAWRRPNRLAVRMGLGLLTVSLAVLVTGIVLLRVGLLAPGDQRIRDVAYWIHVAAPLGAVWLYVLHRLAGPRINWRAGWAWSGAVVVLVGSIAGTHLVIADRESAAPDVGAVEPFAPSLARTVSGGLIPAASLMVDDYCRTCHADVHDGWARSAHRFSSFNNPIYLASVRETREVAEARDGSVRASRWCAGCHDPVPLFAGEFDGLDLDHLTPSADAGITCTACHAIERIDSTLGNADYAIREPVHYPFAFSENTVLRTLSAQLIKAKPSLHRRTFLKPVHRSAEFCSACHKVHIPYEVTQYKEFLRGQNHYDSFLLSGVSGHGARSFYYPERGFDRCAGCHMPLLPSGDFGAQRFDEAIEPSVHDHLFPAANTGIAALRGDDRTVADHQAFLARALRVDVFGIKEGGRIDGALTAPLGLQGPELVPGRRYLIEVVVRTVGVGHAFTQGTADSNEVWVDVAATSGGRTLGRSGALTARGDVDPWAHFLNVYMLDRHGRRVDRRNVQDIFVPLYDRQIPPGAAQVVHYALDVPSALDAPITLDVRVNYRKFPQTLLRFALGQETRHEVPITSLAHDRVTLPVREAPPAVVSLDGEDQIAPPEWERWNDYGIALLLEAATGSERGELRQAAEAFARVEALGRPDGPLNLARVYYREGRLADAADALARAAASGAPPWTVAWLSGLVNKERGALDEAVRNFQSVVEEQTRERAARGFDFSRDYEVINELGLTLFERAKVEPFGSESRRAFLREAVERFERTLSIDAENVTAHYNLSLIHDQLGDADRAEHHRQLHARYKPDENAAERAAAWHRMRFPAADREAQAIVIHELTTSPPPHHTPEPR